MVSASLGINYGQIGDNLPAPEKAVPLVQSIGAKKVRLYDANPLVLRAFAGTDIELTVEVGNEHLSEMSDPQRALAWVRSNVQEYLPATKITGIMVGNEVLTLYDSALSNNLVAAMQTIHGALVTLGLDKQIKVTTSHSFNVMKTSYPPSAGAFKQDLMQHITEILEFHVQTASPFCVNIYPYFAYKANPQKIPLAYAVFEPNSGFLDPNTSVQYDNMFLAQIDAVYSALSLLGYEELSVCVAETGWPSKGDADEAGATIDNAAKYNGNLMKMNINDEVDVYIFALFNENMKPGPTSERNFGLFKPDTSPVYSVDRHTTDELSASLSAIKRFRLILFLCLASTALL
ncbi:hypothetical protein FH972_020645 [Carpinus fangiana]|uniref:glucan endo-1,3-beta-D-glucosidase n=1 Tax=Carpinus fangiana TaxID=176857 RepID=A0A5N6RTU5_9ROSI|nr:hypothetical protein FH972_020645 [Carpinus fangiana]